MASILQRLLKAEQDARNAQAFAMQNQAVIDYNVMMGNIEDPSEEEEEEDNE